MPKVFNRDIELSGTSRIVKGSTVIVAGDGSVPGATPATNSITTAMLQDGAVTPQKMSSNNVSGLLGYDSGGAPTQIDGFASGAVLKDNGAGATPSFGFLSALSAETPGLAPTRAIFRTACFTYDFAVDGGTIGTITPASTIQIPTGSIIMAHLAFYRVLTTCTSATDAAEIAIIVPTDGTVIPAIAISNVANPWDIGGHAPTSISSSLVPVTTAARDFQVVISVENVTAGKFTFTVPYLEIG